MPQGEKKKKKKIQIQTIQKHFQQSDEDTFSTSYIHHREQDTAEKKSGREAGVASIQRAR